MKGLKSSVLMLVVALATSAAHAEIEWNGFGSAFVGVSSNRTLRPKGFTDKSAQFGRFSLLGLNVGSNVGDNLKFASQLVAQDYHGTGEWAMQARWAFLRTDIGGVTFKLGRQLMPALIGSEYASVHYLLPYRATPDQMNLIVASSQFDGVTASYKFGMAADHTLTLSLFGGSPILDPIPTAGIDVIGSTKDLTGATLVYNGPGYLLQVSAMHQISTYAVYSNGTALLNLDGGQDIVTAGYRYDRGGFVSWGEWGMMKSDNGNTVAATGEKFAKNTTSAYALVGYHLGAFLPRYTYAQTQGVLGYQANHFEETHTVGVNYKVNDQAIAKLEYQMVSVPEKNRGPGTSTRPLPPAFGGTEPGPYDTKSGGAVFAGIDFVF